MSDVVDTIVQLNGTRRYLARFTNVSDGTGESAVIKVSRAALLNSNKVIPTKLNVEWIQWSIQGFSSVRLLWDHTTPDEIAVLAVGNGYRDFTYAGVLADPASAGGTGDILFTTAGAVANATYDIYLCLQLSN